MGSKRIFVSNSFYRTVTTTISVKQDNLKRIRERIIKIDYKYHGMG